MPHMARAPAPCTPRSYTSHTEAISGCDSLVLLYFLCRVSQVELTTGSCSTLCSTFSCMGQMGTGEPQPCPEECPIAHTPVALDGLQGLGDLGLHGKRRRTFLKPH